MRIAIVGTGISGNVAAYLLNRHHHITVYERDLRPGGHSHTIDIDHGGRRIAVDTGFIVYNEVNYPGLTALFGHLGVETKYSDMGFSVSLDDGRFEWAGRETDVFSGLFAQRRNILNPLHLKMLADILRFQKMARADLAADCFEGRSLGDWFAWRRISRRVQNQYVIPMGAAIWSTPVSKMLEFPAKSFFSFCENHALLQWNRPRWRTVEGGSRMYVEKMIRTYRDRLRLGASVVRIERSPTGVTIQDSLGHTDRYDTVVIAAHSDQALAMLGDPSPQEEAILGAVGYRPNSVYVHCDPKLMPRRRAAWTSWNYLATSRSTGLEDIAVTYWMNALQGIDRTRPIFVSLNPPEEPNPDLTFARMEAMHPQFDAAAMDAQTKLHQIQGRNRTWYAGAWTGHGFHEDGLRSGVTVADSLGASIPWRDSDDIGLVVAAE